MNLGPFKETSTLDFEAKQPEGGAISYSFSQQQEKNYLFLTVIECIVTVKVLIYEIIPTIDPVLIRCEVLFQS